MDLFNLLCVDREISLEGDLLIPSLIAISVVLFLYGIINIVKNFDKNDCVSKKKFKRGLISLILFIIFVVISLFVISLNKNKIIDPCNSYSPMIVLSLSLMGIVTIFIPIIFIIKAIIELLKNNKDKIDKLYNFFIYIMLAIIIFLILVIFKDLIEVFVDIPKSSSWATCWCK